MKSQQLLCLLLVVYLAGCASSNERAPVVERSIDGRSEAASQTEQKEKDWRPEVHVVQKGDTLFGIAFNYGFDYRDLAEFNGIKNPDLIALGQQIRLPKAGYSRSSPAAAATSGSASSSASVSSVPASVPILVAAKPTAGGSIKDQPKLVKYPYSLTALAQIEKIQDQTAPVVASAAKPEAKVVVVAVPVVENKAAVETAAAATAGDDEALVWSMPAQGKLLSRFSEAANRKGIDIGGQVGQPIVASAPGKVVYSGSGLRGYGNLIIIKHNNTYLSAYAHNDQILVKEGQAVTRGQKIATMGNSDTDQAKLHFEVRRLGKPVDPANYLPIEKS